MNGLDSSYCGSRKKGTRRTANARGESCFRGFDITRRIADSRCFFPMYPFGHRVSLTSSIGITSGLAVTERRLATSMDGRRWVDVKADGIIVGYVSCDL